MAFSMASSAMSTAASPPVWMATWEPASWKAFTAATRLELGSGEVHVVVLVAYCLDVRDTSIQLLNVLEHVHHLPADGHLSAARNIEKGLDAIHAAHIHILETSHSHGGELHLRTDDAGLQDLLVEQVGGPQLAEVIHGRVIQNRATGIAVGLAQEPSITRIFRTGSHAGHFQGQAVDHCHVTALIDEHHRMVRRDRIEIVPGRSASPKGD